ncbi:MAG: hypothetical protein EZS28_005863, partial [Streblomastix strix]
MQHSDYVSGYMQLGEVLKSLSIHPQSFEISKQNFFDSPITELTSSGVKYTRAPLGAREDPLTDCTTNMSNAEQVYFGKSVQGIESLEHLQFWFGFSTACGPFYQFQLLKDATALWESAIYAREQAVISGNSLSDLCTKNSVSVSLLESIIEGKRHCGIFINIPLCEIDRQAIIEDLGTPFQYKIPFDITFSRVHDLNQLNPIFNSFRVLTRNYATLHLQLWIQGFLQDLKVVCLNKNYTVQNNHLAYHMIPPEKPDIVYLLSGDDADDLSYKRQYVRIINMQNAAVLDKIRQNSIFQIGTAKFDTLEIQNVNFNIENKEVIISLIQKQKIINFPTQVFRTQSSNFPFSGFDKDSGSMQSIISFSNIKTLFMTFAMSQYLTWFFPVLFTGLNLVIDQNNIIPSNIILTNASHKQCIIVVIEALVGSGYALVPKNYLKSFQFYDRFLLFVSIIPLVKFPFIITYTLVLEPIFEELYPRINESSVANFHASKYLLGQSVLIAILPLYSAVKQN